MRVGYTGDDFTQLDPGTYDAACYGLIDLGIRDGTFGPKHQMIICFEVEGEENLTDDGRPMSIYAWRGMSMHPKAKLRKDVDNWRGTKLTKEQAEDFELDKLIGKRCQLIVAHTEEGKHKVEMIVAPKGPKDTTPYNDTFVLDGSVTTRPDNVSETIWEMHTEGMKSLRVVEERKKQKSTPHNEEELLDDDIPF